MGNRSTKVNRLSSKSLFLFQNDLYVNLLYYMYTCCYTKNELKVYTKAFECFSRPFEGKFKFQGLFKSVRTLGDLLL